MERCQRMIDGVRGLGRMFCGTEGTRWMRRWWRLFVNEDGGGYSGTLTIYDGPETSDYRLSCSLYGLRDRKASDPPTLHQGLALNDVFELQTD
ncbi:hypothetical protein PIB30_097986 [Stylosanthes scabra]|uniref:Uncharacterized protein n=1 Tax=Stylosanthes scabra TaxID=79078 RepID=A0ABU6ZV59_9FABA|nr:hypothetical protein [Stylosanthes scabra]